MNIDAPTRAILRPINKAIFDFQMIQDGDRVLLACSGGKDSVTLARTLSVRKRIIPHHYSIDAIYVSSDFHTDYPEQITWIESFLAEHGIPLHRSFIQIKPKPGDKPLNCFWCAWNRRKAIFEKAQELGCNKVTFGHHLDDFAETVLLNTLYHGRIEGHDPVVRFFEGELHLIRPLIYLQEHRIRRYIRQMNFPIWDPECPLANDSRRLMMKQFLLQFPKRDKDQIVKNLLRIAVKQIPDGSDPLNLSESKFEKNRS